MVLDTTTYILSTTPTPEDLGEQTFTLKLKDSLSGATQETYNLLVLFSPCEEEGENVPKEKLEPEKTKTSPKREQKFKIPYGAPRF